MRLPTALVVVLSVSMVSASPAHAQSAEPSVVSYPLEVKRTGTPTDLTKPLQKRYEILFHSLDGVSVPTFSKVETAITQLKRADCDRNNECLKDLASIAQVTYAVFATVEADFSRTKVIATGRVVRVDGQQMGEIQTITLPRGAVSFEKAADKALTQLLAALKLASLSPVLPAKVEPVPPVPVVVAEPPPPPPPLVVDPGPVEKSSSSAVKTTGVVMLGVGGAALIAGGVLFGLGSSTGVTVSSSGLVVPAANQSVSDADAAYRKARVLQPAGVGLLIGGGAVAVTGLVLALLPAKSESVKVSVIPLHEGGAFVSFQGVLP